MKTNIFYLTKKTNKLYQSIKKTNLKAQKSAILLTTIKSVDQKKGPKNQVSQGPEDPI